MLWTKNIFAQLSTARLTRTNCKTILYQRQYFNWVLQSRRDLLQKKTAHVSQGIMCIKIAHCKEMLDCIPPCNTLFIPLAPPPLNFITLFSCHKLLCFLRAFLSKKNRCKTSSSSTAKRAGCSLSGEQCLFGTKTYLS